MLTAHAKHVSVHERVVANRLYIIDFGQSRQLSLGPGVQRAITLPETQIEPPDGLLHFDPYSWDIYCAGRMMEYFVEVRCRPRAASSILSQCTIAQIQRHAQG